MRYELLRISDSSTGLLLLVYQGIFTTLTLAFGLMGLREDATQLQAGVATGAEEEKSLAPQEGRRVLLPESEEEARVRYRAAWRRYRRLRFEFPLLILSSQVGLFLACCSAASFDSSVGINMW